MSTTSAFVFKCSTLFWGSTTARRWRRRYLSSPGAQASASGFGRTKAEANAIFSIGTERSSRCRQRVLSGPLLLMLLVIGRRRELRYLSLHYLPQQREFRIEAHACGVNVDVE